MQHMVSKTMFQLGHTRSNIRELFEYGMQKSKEIGAENIFDFSIGNPSTPAPDAVKEAILSILAETNSVELNGYTVAAGDAASRAKIAASLNRRFGSSYTADELFLTVGAAPALVSCIRALMVPEAEFVLIAPYFAEYVPFISANGGKIVVVPPDEPNFQIRLDALDAAIGPHTQAVLINSPNNPCGCVYSEDTLRSLAELLKRRSRELGHPIYLISDEPYRELVYDGCVVPWVPQYYPDTLVCYSYSKVLSLPGQRIGWILFPKTLSEYSDIRDAIAGSARVCGHVCANSLYQRVAALCCDVQPDLSSYIINRKLLYEGLTEMGYHTAKPQGAFYLFVRAPEGDGNAFSDRAKAQGILAVPGRDFGCAPYVRLCYCLTTDKAERSLPVFRRLIESNR